MLYMIVEHYLHGPEPVYERYSERGRMLPDGLRYVDSWVVDAQSLDCCYQLMETDERSLIDAWADQWRDLVRFEIHPVIGSAEAAARVDAGD